MNTFILTNTPPFHGITESEISEMQIVGGTGKVYGELAIMYESRMPD